MEPVKPVMCTDIKCEKGCDFNGGFSGFCSVCWNALSHEEKEAASAKQRPLQEGRQEEFRKKRAREEEEERLRNQEKLAAQEVAREEQRKKQHLEEEAEQSRVDPKCQRVASYKTLEGDGDFFLDSSSTAPSPPEWLQWSWVKLGHSCSCEVGTCGLYNASTYPLAKHQHPEITKERMEQLFSLTEQLSHVLRHTEEGSSEGGEPWVGFHILPADMPGLSRKSSVEQIFLAVLGEECFSQLRLEKVSRHNDHRIFANASDGDDEDALAPYREAAKLIFSVAKKNTAFRLVPAGDGDYYVGPSFVAARTPEGDIIGVRTHVVWT